MLPCKAPYGRNPLWLCLCVNLFVLVAEFSIWTREAGAGGLSIAVEGPSKAEIAFEDRKDGSSGVSYIVQEPGENRGERWMLCVAQGQFVSPDDSFFLRLSCCGHFVSFFLCGCFFGRLSHLNSFRHQETTRFPSVSTTSTSPTAPSSSRWPRRPTTPVASLLPVFR